MVPMSSALALRTTNNMPTIRAVHMMTERLRFILVFRSILQKRAARWQVAVEASEAPGGHKMPDVIDSKPGTQQRTQHHHIDSRNPELDPRAGMTAEQLANRAQERKLPAGGLRGHRPDAAKLTIPGRLAGEAGVVSIRDQAGWIGDRETMETTFVKPEAMVAVAPTPPNSRIEIAELAYPRPRWSDRPDRIDSLLRRQPRLRQFGECSRGTLDSVKGKARDHPGADVERLRAEVVTRSHRANSSAARIASRATSPEQLATDALAMRLGEHEQVGEKP